MDIIERRGLWVTDESIYGGKRDAVTKASYDGLISDMRAAVHFDIVSVAEMLRDGSLSGWSESSFAPPFAGMILEYGMAGYMDRVAIYAKCRDVVSDFKDPAERSFATNAWWRSIVKGIDGDAPQLALKHARWLITLFLMAKGEGELTFGAPIGRAAFPLDGDGRLFVAEDGGYFFDLWMSNAIVRHIHPVPGKTLLQEDLERYAGEMMRYDAIEPFLATCALLNTKNIEAREVFPFRQQRREAERKNAPAPVTFRVLTVNVPGRDRGASAGRPNPSAISDKPLHIVRGHLARYGADFGKGKLFGRLEGQFWIPSHVRGSADVGLVGKDYAVNAPKNQAA